MKEKVKDTGDKKCRWRADLWGKYFYFDEFLNVKFSWEENIEVDNIRWSVGNYFETVDEAEAALLMVKNLLQKR